MYLQCHDLTLESVTLRFEYASLLRVSLWLTRLILSTVLGVLFHISFDSRERVKVSINRIHVVVRGPNLSLVATCQQELLSHRSTDNDANKPSIA